MLFSGSVGDWSIKFNGQSKTGILYLGATSLSDLHRSTHKALAYTSTGEGGALFSLGFDEIQPLPIFPPQNVDYGLSRITPASVTVVSQAQGNGQYYDSDILPILYSGAIIGASNAAYPAVLVLDLFYDQQVYLAGAVPRAVSPFIYMYSQKYEQQALNQGSATVLASTSITKLYNDATITSGWVSGWTSGINQACNQVRLVITATYNAAYSNTKTTLADCLPYTYSLSAAPAPIPNYGLLLDPVTGSVIFLSGLEIDQTAIKSVNIL